MLVSGDGHVLALQASPPIFSAAQFLGLLAH